MYQLQDNDCLMVKLWATKLIWYLGPRAEPSQVTDSTIQLAAILSSTACFIHNMQSSPFFFPPKHKHRILQFPPSQRKNRFFGFLPTLQLNTKSCQNTLVQWFLLLYSESLKWKQIFSLKKEIKKIKMELKVDLKLRHLWRCFCYFNSVKYKS